MRDAILKKVKLSALLISLAALCIGCDCLQSVSGVVLDKNTGQPIDNVKVKKFEDAQYAGILTDSIGIFQYSNITGGRLFKSCPENKLMFVKKGYKTDTRSLPNNYGEPYYAIYLIPKN